MSNWNNLDTLDSYKTLSQKEQVNLADVMSGENGAKRVQTYQVPMAAGLSYNYASKQVNDDILKALSSLAEEAELAEKYKELYNGAVINTGEKRLVLHQLTRGQLGETVTADGVDKRDFYVSQQKRIADFANKVHNGEITNAAGEKFTTVVQIGIGGSDLGPRAMYIALENWAKKNNTFKMDAKFISNVDPDDAAAVLKATDVAHAIFVLVSKSGTTLETLTNESFVKDALKKAGLDCTAIENIVFEGKGNLYVDNIFAFKGEYTLGLGEEGKVSVDWEAAAEGDVLPDIDTPLIGVNLASACGGSVHGKIGTEYFYPSFKDLYYFKSKGVRLFRFPFRWERIQHELNGDLDLDSDIQESIEKLEDFSKDFTDLHFQIALNYGSRDEIVIRLMVRSIH